MQKRAWQRCIIVVIKPSTQLFSGASKDPSFVRMTILLVSVSKLYLYANKKADEVLVVHIDGVAGKCVCVARALR